MRENTQKRSRQGRGKGGYEKKGLGSRGEWWTERKGKGSRLIMGGNGKKMDEMRDVREREEGREGKGRGVGGEK